MQTNKEWLFSLSLDELYAWFDAEHVYQSKFTNCGKPYREGDAVLDSGIIRPIRMVGTQRDNNGTCPIGNGTRLNMCNKSGENVTDSREKLEADVRAGFGELGFGVNRIMEWLDRQAAITENEIGDVLLNQDDRIAELQKQVDKLERSREANIAALEDYRVGMLQVCHERDELQAKVDELTEKCKGLRESLGSANEAGEKLQFQVEHQDALIFDILDAIAEYHDEGLA